MLSCKEVCYIVSESLDGQLPWHKRSRMRIHLTMCKACRRMARQMKWLRAIAMHYGPDLAKESPPEWKTLSEDSRKRILMRLQQEKKDSTGHE